MPNEQPIRTNQTDDTTSNAGSPFVPPQSKPVTPIREDVASVIGKIKLPDRTNKDFRAKGDAPAQQGNLTTLEEQVAAAEITVQEETPHTQSAENTQPKEFDIPSVHTLKDDLHRLVEGQQLSMVKAAALEAEKRSKQESATEATAVAQPRKNLLPLILLSVALIVVALGTLAFLGMRFVSGGSQLSATSTASAPTSSIMFTEQSVVYPISGLTAFDIKQQLASARAQDMRLGSIQRVVPVVPNTTGGTRPATIAEFLAAIDAHAPDGFTRALSDEFLLGYHALSANAPIMVISILSYERAFAGMLAWEPTLPDDLAPFFASIPVQIFSADGAAHERTFEDVTIQNYDIRVVRDAGGDIKLLYTFPTRSILVIAENPISLNEILARLHAERQI